MIRLLIIAITLLPLTAFTQKRTIVISSNSPRIFSGRDDGSTLDYLTHLLGGRHSRKNWSTGFVYTRPMLWRDRNNYWLPQAPFIRRGVEADGKQIIIINRGGPVIRIERNGRRI